ncbi:Metabotropic glutamate receptor 2 [Cichlidogyrus casuarinus]|uniref:Metabotropic glutamate receptor 2 n=1 Tax=Cichlidogyrus casuarinus TaxID=1844966 RepID=A0ABD2QJ76_9PLAT
MNFVPILLLYCCNVVLSSDKKSVEVDGDILLGGLFPVHAADLASDACGILNPERGVQRVEAMLFTLDKINNDPKILPGLKLGASIWDTCSSDQKALQHSLTFIEMQAGEQQCSNSQQKQKGKKFYRGVVGGSYSSVSIMVSNLLGLFSIPQISYASTSPALSLKTTHKLFARTVPSDLTQAKAMAKLVKKFNWTYVSTVRSEGDYGDAGMLAFKDEAKKLNVCIASNDVIKKTSTKEEIIGIARELTKESNKARTVVVFLRIEDAERLLSAVTNVIEGRNSSNLVWVASDGWGQENGPVEHNSVAARGALTIEINSKSIKEFENYYGNLTLNNNKRNPWFKELWEKTFNCSTDTQRSDRESCQKFADVPLKEKLGKSFKHESKIQFIVQAIYAFARTLDKQFGLNCAAYNQSKAMCLQKLANISGQAFYQEMMALGSTGFGEL